jgi:hypothetical protein
VSNAYGRKLGLEQGTQRAFEKILQTTGDDTVEGTLKSEAVCQVNGVNTDGSCKTTPISTDNVTVRWRLECSASGGGTTTQSSTDATTFDGYSCPSGTVKEARYIEVSAIDRYTPMFPVHFSSINGDGTYHMSATAGMRTQ